MLVNILLIPCSTLGVQCLIDHDSLAGLDFFGDLSQRRGVGFLLIQRLQRELHLLSNYTARSMYYMASYLPAATYPPM